MSAMTEPTVNYLNDLGLQISEEAFEELLKSNTGFLQESFFLTIFSHSAGNEERLRAMADKLQIQFSEKYMMVCLISVQSTCSSMGRRILNVMTKDVFQQALSEMDFKAISFFDEEGTLNIVINTYDLDPKRKLEAAVSFTRQKLRFLADFHLYFGLGPVVDSYHRLYVSKAAAYNILQQGRANISSGERVFESGTLGKYTYSVQQQLMKYFLDQDAAGVADIIRSQIQNLQIEEEHGRHLAEGFLMYYLKNLTGECQKIGTSIDNFESYLPSVTCLLSSDVPGAADALMKLTEQIINHVSNRGSVENHHLLRMAKEYVRAHLADEKLNLEAVSNHVGLSRVYFCKLFHQLEGISFSAYLKKIRIEKAKQLLMTTNLKMFEISSDVGFSHAKYFGQVFKQEVGLTPVEYQRTIQKSK